MKKTNPLFVDSTKFQGDTINSEIEVRGVSDDILGTLEMKIFRQSGEEVRLALEPQGQKFRKGSLFLEHREAISYQFLIHHEGVVTHSTELKSIEATYFIQDTWVVEAPKAFEIMEVSSVDMGPKPDLPLEVEEFLL